jgi:phage portal protein BeeE
VSFLSRALTGVPEKRTLDSAPWLASPYDSTMVEGWATMPGEHTREGDSMALGAFYACVTLLADIISSLPLQAYRKRNGVDVICDPAPTLFKTSPYPEITWFSWLWMFMESLAVTGNGLGYITSYDGMENPAGIIPIHPSFVSITIADWQGTKWPKPLYTVLGEEIPTERMFHIKRYPLAAMAWGMSPVQKAASAIGLGLASQRYGLRYFQDAANPSGILTSDQELTPIQAAQNQKRWLQSHQGRRLPAVLSGGLTWQSVTLTPEECLAKGTLLTMADGTRRAVEDIAVGEEVMAWDGAAITASRVVATGAPPIKPMVKITTARGRVLTCTADHPMLALSKLSSPAKDPEWIHAGNLVPGQHVRVALGFLEESTKPDYSSATAYFLGAMVADGNIRRGGPRWYTEDVEIFDRMTEVVEELGGHIVPEGPRNFGIRMGGRNSVIGNLITEAGLWDTYSHTKFVPESIIAGGPVAWREFIAGYCDGDGYVTQPGVAESPRVTFNSTSRELLYGVQHLLALLGVNASVTHKPSAAGWRVMPDGEERLCRTQWTLNVTGIRQVQKFAEQIDVSHAGKKNRLAEYLSSGTTTLRRESTDHYDRIKSVEHLGDGESVGVTIEGTHNHVTNGLISHNSQFIDTRSFQVGEIARWFRIPPHMIGDTEKSTSWGSGLAEQTLGFVKYTLMPWLVAIEQALTQILPRGQFAKFDLDELLRADVLTRWEAYRVGRDAGAYSVNDIRAREDMPGIGKVGDIHLQPANFVPLGTPPPAAPQADQQPSEPFQPKSNKPPTNSSGDGDE